MMSTRLFKMALSFSIALLAADAGAFTISGQNEARYGRGLQPGRGITGDFHYFENYLDLTAGYSDFRFYLRQAYKTPGEYDQQASGLKAFDKTYVEYAKEHYSLRGGDFYRVWGKGLLFGNQELRDLNSDSGLKGFLAEARVGGFEASVIRGVEPDTSGSPMEAAEGGYLSQRLPMDFRLGAGYFHMEAGPRHPEFERHGFEAEKSFDWGSFYAVYASDRLSGEWETGIGKPHRFYHAFFATGSIYGDGWSVYYDYRNYRLLTFYEVKPYIGDVRQPILQYPPTGRPENTFRLMDAYPRILRYHDDIGYQIELTANRWEWELLLNYSIAAEESESSFFPDLTEHLSPYHGILFKADRQLGQRDKLGVRAAGQRDVELQFEFPDGGRDYNKSKRIGLGLDYEHIFPMDISLSGELQAMSVVNLYGVPPEEKFWEQYLGVTAGKGGWGSLTLGVMRSEWDAIVEGAAWPEGIIGSGGSRSWPSALLVIQAIENHRLDFFYGYERGGLSCAGGVCRVVNPFKGVKLTLTSSF